MHAGMTLSELSRLPVERLAKLLMEWAIEDQRLLMRRQKRSRRANRRAVAAESPGD